jgi:hypothetical protein
MGKVGHDQYQCYNAFWRPHLDLTPGLSPQRELNTRQFLRSRMIMLSREVVKAKGLNPPNPPFTKGGLEPSFMRGGYGWTTLTKGSGKVPLS